MTGPDRSAEPLTATEVRRRAVSGVGSIAGREVAIRAIGLLGNVVIARLLTTRDFGAVAFGYTLIAFGTFLSDGGIGAAFIQRREDPTRPELRALLGFSLGATLLAIAVIAAISLPFGQAGALAIVMAFSMAIGVLASPTGIMTERTMNYRPIIISDVTQTVSYNVAAVVLVLIGLGVWGLALAVLLSTVIGTTLLIRLGPIGFVRPSLSFRTVRPYLSFGLQFQAGAVINTFRDVGLNVMAAGIGGLSVLGVWSLANRILLAIMLVFNSMWRVSFPAVSRLVETGEDPNPSIQRALELTTTFTGFVVVVLGGCAPALVPVVFGSKWSPVIAVLPWAAAGIIISGPVSVAATGLLYARREIRIVLITVTCHTLTWYAVSVPLLPHLGAEALGIGWFAGAIVDACILSRTLIRLGIRVLAYSAPPIIASVCTGALGWLIASTVEPRIAAVVASVVAVEAVYLTIMFVARRAMVLDLFSLLGRAAVPRLRALRV